jgi:FtsP/CotA-like multicopper oxidase with cupredoxin domain
MNGLCRGALLVVAFTGLGLALDFPEARPNDNRNPAGHLASGALTLRLEVRDAQWNPEGRDGPMLHVQAFSEEGALPQIPGPLIRVPQGTEVRASVRNTLAADTVTLHGFNQRPGSGDHVLTIPPGAVRELAFRTGSAGTYYYWVSTAGHALDKRTGVESQLSGALIVDRRDSRAAPIASS